MPVWQNSKVFDINKSFNNFPIKSIERNIYGVKTCPNVWKNYSRWLRDLENMVDEAKSHIPREGESVVSFWQHVAEYWHTTKLWVNLKNLTHHLRAYNHQIQVLIEVIENYHIGHFNN